MRRLNLDENTKYGRLTYVKEAGKRGNRRVCTWICDCGSIKDIPLINITSKKTSSCGCLHKEKVIEQGPPMRSHMMTNTRTYISWKSMVQRCTYPKHKSWQNYGGAGIKVCESWMGNFENFLKDMGKRPEGMSLDRIDSLGDYTPENCKWSTPTEQAANRATSVFLETPAGIKTIAEAARFFGLSPTTLRDSLLSESKKLANSIGVKRLTAYMAKEQS